MTTDFILKLFTGYGQKMYRLLLAFLFFVTLGTIFFWSQATLTLPPGAEEATKKATKEAALSEQASPKWADRIVYSADLLIPVLDLRAGDTRIVTNSAMWFYEVVQIFVGWLLIALLIAWITAVAKGDR
jgi:hypothetical protein